MEPRWKADSVGVPTAGICLERPTRQTKRTTRHSTPFSFGCGYFSTTTKALQNKHLTPRAAVQWRPKGGICGYPRVFLKSDGQFSLLSHGRQVHDNRSKLEATKLPYCSCTVVEK
jgi:hypothetical protein